MVHYGLELGQGLKRLLQGGIQLLLDLTDQKLQLGSDLPAGLNVKVQGRCDDEWSW